MNVKKSKNGNLENKRGIFFQVGLILSLAFVLAAFEWETEHRNQIDFNTFDRGDVIEEIIDVTFQKKELPPKPQPVVTPVFIEVKNDEHIEDEILITSEVTLETENNPFIVLEEAEKETEEQTIFTSVGEMPTFPGGMEALYQYLKDNLTYPKTAVDANISGTVYVDFVVWKDGSIRMAEVVRKIGGGCDEEALRVVQNMPHWNPGIQRTLKVNVQMNLPVKFKLNRN